MKSTDCTVPNRCIVFLLGSLQLLHQGFCSSPLLIQSHGIPFGSYGLRSLMHLKAILTFGTSCNQNQLASRRRNNTGTHHHSSSSVHSIKTHSRCPRPSDYSFVYVTTGISPGGSMQHYDHQIHYATKWPGRSRPPVHEQGPLCTNGDAATVLLQVQPSRVASWEVCFISFDI